MKLVIPTLIAVAALSALSAQAEGLYLGGSVGGAGYNGDDLGGAPTSRNTTGYKLYGGYAFNPNFGVEAGYVDLGKVTSTADGIASNGVFVDAVGTLPLGNHFSALGRIGVFNGNLKGDVSGSGNGSALKLGVGLQYDISPNVALRGEWERYQFDAINIKPNTDFYSVGLNYAFK